MYYTLLVQYEPFSDWIPEYGAYNLQDVLDEMDHLKENDDVFAVRFIKTSDNQQNIDHEVEKLNHAYALN